jgi:sugar phosphate isomerase/epimerase
MSKSGMNKPGMKIAINAQQLADTHSLSEILGVFESYGVKALELWPANLPGSSQTPEEHERYETKDVDAVRALLQQRGFQVACVTLGFHAAPLCIAKGGTQRLTEALQGAVDAAIKLESQLVNCYTAHVSLSLFLEAVRPAAEYAASRGVVITLENEAHDESALPESIASLVQTVNSPGFRTQYDPCNYYHAYAEPIPYAYEIIREHVGYVHLKGGCYYADRSGVYKGSLMRHSSRDHIGYVPLDEAAFSVDGILRVLKADGYKGWVTLEPHVPSAVIVEVHKRDLAYVQSLLES